MDTPIVPLVPLMFDVCDTATVARDLARAAMVEAERVRARLALADETHAELWAAIGQMRNNEQAVERRLATTLLKRLEAQDTLLEAFRTESLAQRDQIALLDQVMARTFASMAAFVEGATQQHATEQQAITALTARLLKVEALVAPSWPDATTA